MFSDESDYGTPHPMSKKLHLADFVTIDRMPSASRSAEGQGANGVFTAYLEIRGDNSSVIGVVALDFTTETYMDRHDNPRVRLKPVAMRTFTRDELVFGELEK